MAVRPFAYDTAARINRDAKSAGEGAAKATSIEASGGQIGTEKGRHKTPTGSSDDR
jgi:hypothetical protein